MSDAFARIGIHSVENYRAVGVDHAYARMIAGGDAPHIMKFIALAMALEDRDWRAADPAMKANLRERHAAILATVKAGHLPPAAPEDNDPLPPPLSRFLDDMGLRNR